MDIILIEKITHNGITYNTGDFITGIDEKSAKRLIDLGVAFSINPPKEQVGVFEGLTQEEYEQLVTELDRSANKEPLVDAARNVGVELSEELKTKREIIDAIIEQNLEDEVLAELRKGE